MSVGIVFVAIIVMWLAYLGPWFAERSAHEGLADPNSVRFVDSMRFLTEEIVPASSGLAAVSTPLTRRAQLVELGLIAKGAARRRRNTFIGLLVVTMLCAASTIVRWLPWWANLISVGLMVFFLVLARVSAVAMYKRLDAQAEHIMANDDEVTESLVLIKDQSNIQFDLATELNPSESMAEFMWHPIPAGAQTYVQQPLVARTVRTIDLSAPNPLPVVPTADALESDTEQVEVGYHQSKAVNE